MYVPDIGDRLPRWGNPVFRALGRSLLRLFGWRFEGTLPNREKLLIIAAPHTTAWDFVLGMVALLALGVRVSWLGIDWVARYPVMRWIGGIPIEPGATQGVVEESIERFESRERFVLGLSPEGSRKKVVPWRTGFYRIALGARAPILLVSIDFSIRLLRLGPLLVPSGDLDADMETIRAFYAEYTEKYPDRFGI